MYENLNFLQKTWQSNAKSLTRIDYTMTKFESVHSLVAQAAKVFGIFENKQSLGVRSLCQWVQFCKKRIENIGYYGNPLLLVVCSELC